MVLFAKDEKTDELHRMATQYHDKKDFNTSINLLKHAKERMMVSEVNYGIERWIRLPKNLQKAGLFDEAMKEFDFLINDIDRRNRQYSPHLDNNAHIRMRFYDLSVIYNAMSLVCKWEKLHEKKDQYENLGSEYYEKFLNSK